VRRLVGPIGFDDWNGWRRLFCCRGPLVFKKDDLRDAVRRGSGDVVVPELFGTFLVGQRWTRGALTVAIDGIDARCLSNS